MGKRITHKYLIVVGLCLYLIGANSLSFTCKPYVFSEILQSYRCRRHSLRFYAFFKTAFLLCDMVQPVYVKWEITDHQFKTCWKSDSYKYFITPTNQSMYPSLHEQLLLKMRCKPVGEYSQICLLEFLLSVLQLCTYPTSWHLYIMPYSYAYLDLYTHYILEKKQTIYWVFKL